MRPTGRRTGSRKEMGRKMRDVATETPEETDDPPHLPLCSLFFSFPLHPTPLRRATLSHVGRRRQDVKQHRCSSLFSSPFCRTYIFIYVPTVHVCVCVCTRVCQPYARGRTRASAAASIRAPGMHNLHSSARLKIIMS